MKTDRASARAVLLAMAFGALTGVCRSADAQSQERVSRVGFLFAGTIALRPQVQGFYQGLREQGFVEGRNLMILRREAQGRFELLPALAAELARENPDVIVAVTPASVSAAMKATQSIPIVFAIVGNPDGQGWVKNLARPEGNVTGPASQFVADSTPKRFQIFREMLPDASRIALLWNPGTPVHPPQKASLEQAAPGARVQLEPVSFRSIAELKEALQAVKASGADALFVLPDPIGFDQRKLIIDFASAHRIPASFYFAEEAEEGGLMGFGIRLQDEYRRAAIYTARILKGAKPGDLPVEQLAGPHFVVNLKTARALGVRIPQSVLVRADRVIE